MKVGLNRAARHAFERGLGAQHARRPVGLRIGPPKQAEQRSTQTGRQHRAHALFHHVQPVAPVAAEGLVATIARERHRHVLARKLADAVSRDRRAVGIRLVVQARKRVDQVEIIAGDRLEPVRGLVALGDHGRECGFVEARIVEPDRAGVDGPVRQAGHCGDHHARVDAAGQKRAERHFRDHAQAHRFAQPLGQLRARICFGNRVVEREMHVPKLARRGHALAALQGQHVPWR